MRTGFGASRTRSCDSTIGRIRRQVRAGAICLVAATAMASCASMMKMYIPPDQVVREEGPTAPNVSWSIVEFDDQGLLFDSRQLDRTIAEVRRLASLREGRLRLVVFVHGWKHDASPQDAANTNGNLRQFPLLLRQFSSGDPQDQVFGLYMAWRGEPLARTEPFNALFRPWISFFSRIRAAGRVARPEFTETLLSVLTAAELAFNDEYRKPQGDRTTSVIIGHSMGGFIVEEALSKAMLGSLVTQLPAVNRSKRESKELLESARQASTLAGRVWASEKECAIRVAALQRQVEACRIDGSTSVPASASPRESLWLNSDLLAKSIREAVLELSIEATSPTITPRCGIYRASSPSIEGTRDRLRALVEGASELRELAPRNPVGGSVSAGFATLESFQALAEAELARLRAGAQSLPIQEFKRRISRLNQRLDLVSGSLASREAELLALEQSRAVSEASSLSGQREALERDAKTRTESASRVLISWKPPADLVLLVNPASRSILARHMIGALKRLRSTFYAAEDLKLPWMLDSEIPWMISVSSRGDAANRVFFPLGAGLDSSGERFREDCELRGEVLEKVSLEARNPHARPCVTRDETAEPLSSPARTAKTSERSLVRSIAPLNDVLLSHRLVPVGPGDAADPDFAGSVCEAAPFETNFDRRGGLGVNEITTCDHRYRLEEVDWDAQPERPPHLRWNDSGYWVIEADRSIIEEHNDIFGYRMHALVAGLIRISQALNPRVEAAPAAIQVPVAAASQ